MIKVKKIKDQKIKCFAYYRGDAKKIPQWKKEIEGFAAEHNYEIIEGFHDLGEKEFSLERNFTEMLLKINDEIKTIIVAEYSYLSEDGLEVEVLGNFLSLKGIDIISAAFDFPGVYDVKIKPIVKRAIKIELNLRMKKMLVARDNGYKLKPPPHSAEHIKLAVSMRKQGIRMALIPSRMAQVGAFNVKKGNKPYTESQIYKMIRAHLKETGEVLPQRRHNQKIPLGTPRNKIDKNKTVQ